jgi:hypothetical protein
MKQLCLQNTFMAVSLIISANVASAQSTCTVFTVPGNFQMTETFPYSPPDTGEVCFNLASPPGTFYGRGFYEAFAYGAGRYVVGPNSGAWAGGPSSMINYAVLEFINFDATLGGNTGNWNYGNRGTWQLADGRRLSAPSLGTRFSNDGRFIKPGVETSVVDIDFTNTGVIEINGGTVVFGRSFQSSGLTRLASDAAATFLVPMVSMGSVEGGRLVAPPSGTELATGSLRNVRLEGAFSVRSGGQLTASGAINVNDKLVLGGASTSPSSLLLSGDLTLSGVGQTFINGSSDNILGNGAYTLTVDTGHTLRGGGQFGYSSPFVDRTVKLVNKGTVLADATDGMSFLGTFDNTSGLVKIVGASGFFASGRFLNRLGGVEIANLATFSQAGAFSGGSIQSLGLATLSGTGTFEDVTLNGAFRVVGATLSNIKINDSVALEGAKVKGVIANNGVLKVTNQSVTLIGDTVLTGPGETQIGSAASSYVYGNGAYTLTVDTGHTLRGGGQFGYSSPFVDRTVRLVNKGTVLVNAPGGMTLSSGGYGFLNEGRIFVSTGAEFDGRTSVLEQSASSAEIDVDGTLRMRRIDLAGGKIVGVGSILGDINAQGGVIAPGHSSGKLTIEGNLLLSGAAELQIEVFGPGAGVGYDWLEVLGDIRLGGTLRLIIGSSSHVGDSFALLTSRNGTMVGFFDSIVAPGFLICTSQSSNGFFANITGISPVPEVSKVLMTLLGGSMLLLRCKGRLLSNRWDG